MHARGMATESQLTCYDALSFDITAPWMTFYSSMIQERNLLNNRREKFDDTMMSMTSIRLL